MLNLDDPRHFLYLFRCVEFLDDDVASNKLEKKIQRSFNNVQSADIGWQTGNGKKLSFSQAQLGRATCLTVASFLSISFGPSYVRRLYIME